MIRTLALQSDVELDIHPWVLDWTQLALYALVVLGVCYLVGYSALSLPLRSRLYGPAWKDVPPEGTNVPVARTLGMWVVDLLQCPKCLGFHLGWLAWALHLGPFVHWTWGWLLAPVLTSALMLIADRFNLFQWELLRERDFEEQAITMALDKARIAEIDSLSANQNRIAASLEQSAEAMKQQRVTIVDASQPFGGKPV